MSAHNVIVLTPAPAGRFLEGVAGSIVLPGQLVQIKAATAMDGTGRHTWELYNKAADGVRCLIAIVRENLLLGRGKEDAYAVGDRLYMYCPIPGDELQVRVSAPGTGTGDNLSIGDLLIADDGTGNFVATTGTPQSEPFIVAEEVSDVVVAGTLVHCYYTGH